MMWHLTTFFTRDKSRFIRFLIKVLVDFIDSPYTFNKNFSRAMSLKTDNK